MPYIYSTLTAGVDYTVYDSTPDKSVVSPERTISIAGGSNVATRGLSLVTPRGVATRVSDEDLETLERNEVFVMHKKNGFLTIGNDTLEDTEKMVGRGDLQTRDTSAPIDPADFESEGLDVKGETISIPPAEFDAPAARKGRGRA